MYTIILTISDTLFHDYGFTCVGVGKTQKSAQENLEKNFIPNFKKCWNRFGGNYSKSKGFHGREDRYGSLEFKTMQDVIAEYGADTLVVKNDEILESDYTYSNAHLNK